MTGGGRFAIARRVIFLLRGPLCSAGTISATNTGTGSNTCFPGNPACMAESGMTTGCLLTPFAIRPKPASPGRPPSMFWQVQQHLASYNRWCQRGVWAKIAAELRDDDNREAILAHGSEPCIPPRKNRKRPIEYDRLSMRSGMSWSGSSPASSNTAVSRPDKKAANFLGFVLGGFNYDYARVVSQNDPASIGTA